jgi:hypothetical protein
VLEPIGSGQRALCSGGDASDRDGFFFLSSTWGVSGSLWPIDLHCELAFAPATTTSVTVGPDDRSTIGQVMAIWDNGLDCMYVYICRAGTGFDDDALPSSTDRLIDRGVCLKQK